MSKIQSIHADDIPLVEKRFSREGELQELEGNIAQYESKLKADKSRLRNRLLQYVIYIGVLIGLIFVLNPYLKTVDQLFGLNTIVIGYGIVACGVLGLAFFTFQTLSRQASMQAEVDILEARKRNIIKFSNISTKAASQGVQSYFDSLVEINVENLGAYYSLVKVHTENSFRASIYSGIVGFLFISLGLVFGYFGTSQSQTMAYITSAAGVLTEFIAGIFFYLYNRTVRQLKEYHDSLLAVQNVLLSFKLVNDVKAESERVKMAGQMLSYLVGSKHITTPMKEN